MGKESRMRRPSRHSEMGKDRRKRQQPRQDDPQDSYPSTGPMPFPVQGESSYSAAANPAAQTNRGTELALVHSKTEAQQVIECLASRTDVMSRYIMRVDGTNNSAQVIANRNALSRAFTAHLHALAASYSIDQEERRASGYTCDRACLGGESCSVDGHAAGRAWAAGLRSIDEASRLVSASVTHFPLERTTRWYRDVIRKIPPAREWLFDGDNWVQEADLTLPHVASDKMGGVVIAMAGLDCMQVPDDEMEILNELSVLECAGVYSRLLARLP